MLASPQGRELRLRVNKERQAAIRAAVRDAKPKLREPAFTRLCAAVRLLARILGGTAMPFPPGGQGSRASDWHVAIGTPVPGDDVLRIAAEAGWPARLCQRGNFFRCIEVWIEGAAVIEVLDPMMQAEYRASMTPANWRSSFGLESAA
jgi:hypothetical protein